jgi:N utilization substance protein B
MQSLFAFRQCQEANYELCHDHIAAAFAPDLNSMEVQDKGALDQQKAAAQKLFDDRFGGTNSSSDDTRVQQAAEDAQAFYRTQDDRDYQFFRKNLVSEAERVFDHYLSVLSLFDYLTFIAGNDKKDSHRHLVSNPWITSLRSHARLRQELTRRNLGWESKAELARGWFKDLLKPDPDYQTYMRLEAPTDDDHRKVLLTLSRKWLIHPGPVFDHFESADIRWAEDAEVVKSLVEKTFKSKTRAEEDLQLQELSLNWEEDREFLQKVFETSARLPKQYDDLISQNTRNWELDRLPLTDRVILEMAIAEWLHFANIPVKVTINEYIELAKEYSTPKSRQFINGILDALARELSARGEIKKSGRGLLDNK